MESDEGPSFKFVSERQSFPQQQDPIPCKRSLNTSLCVFCCLHFVRRAWEVIMHANAAARSPHTDEGKVYKRLVKNPRIIVQ